MNNSVKSQRLAVFLSVFLDMVGFSVVFPLGAAIQNYYIVKHHYFFEGFGRLLEFLQGLNVHGGGGASEFYVSVLFGGLVAGVYSLMHFIFGPIVGGLSDRFGRRPILIFTAIGMLLSYLMWCVAGTFELFLLSRVLGGIMSANLVVASACAADLGQGEQRSRSMAIIGMAFGFGMLIGPALGGLASTVDLSAWLPALTPLSAPALVAAAATFCNIVCLVWFFKETLPLENRRHAPLGITDFFSILRSEHTAIKQISIANFFYIFAFGGTEASLGFLALERFDFGSKQMGILFIFIAITSITTQGVFVRRWAPRLGEGYVCGLGLLVCGVSFLIQGAASTTSVFIASSLGVAIASGLTFPMFPSLVAKYSSADRRGENMGALRSMGALGRAFGPLAAAYLYFFKGSFFLYFLSGALCSIPFLIITYVTKKNYGLLTMKA